MNLDRSCFEHFIFVLLRWLSISQWIEDIDDGFSRSAVNKSILLLVCVDFLLDYRSEFIRSVTIRI